MGLSRHPRRSRGVVAIVAAFALLMAGAVAGLAWDVGRLYYAQRDLQRMANLAALDAARVSGECLGVVVGRQAAAESAALASVNRNGGTAANLPAGSVLLGSVITDSNYVRSFASTVLLHAYAVQVTLAAPMPARLLSVGGGGGTMTASAAAKAVPEATIEVMPGLINVNPAGAQIPVSPTSVVTLATGILQDLTDSEIDPRDLVEEAGAQDYLDFLEDEISAVDLLDFIVNLLTAEGETALATAVATIRGGVDAAETVVPRELLGVPDGFEDPAANLAISTGALVFATLHQINEGRTIPLALPEIPGITEQGSTIIKILERSKSVNGPALRDATGEPVTVARSALISAETTVPVLGLPVLGTAILGIVTEAGRVTAALANITCSSIAQPQPVATIEAHSDVAYVGIGQYDDINSANPQLVPIELGIVPLGLPLFGNPPVRITVKSPMVEVGDDTDDTLTFSGTKQPGPRPQYVDTSGSDALESALASATASLEIEVELVSPSSNPVVLAAVAALEASLEGLLPAAIATATAALGPRLDEVLSAARVTMANAEVRVTEIEDGKPELFTR